MDDVRGDFFGPPHGTTTAAVIVIEITIDHLRAVSILMRKGMGHTAVSATSVNPTFVGWQKILHFSIRS